MNKTYTNNLVTGSLMISSGGTGVITYKESPNDHMLLVTIVIISLINLAVCLYAAMKETK